MKICGVLLAGGGKQAVSIEPPMPHFLERIGHPQSDGLGIVSPSSRKTLVQFLLAWRHHKKIHEGQSNGAIRTSSDLRRALDIDVHYHIDPGLKVGDDFGFERSIEISVNRGMFEKIAGLKPMLEVLG